MKKKLKWLVQRSKFFMIIFRLLSPAYQMLKKIFIRNLLEELKTYGNLNLNEIVYIIRINPPGEGFFSNVFNVLSKVKYATDRGWIPVVDMKNYNTIFHDNGFSGNLWERYYKQPADIRLSDAYKSENVVLSSGAFLYNEFDINKVLDLDKKYIKTLSELMKKFIRFNEQTEIIISHATKELLMGYKVLGVKVRGSDYNLESSKHFDQPKIDDFFYVIEKMFEEGNFHKIFLATEESHIINEFTGYFKDKIIYQNIPRIEEFNPHFKAAEHFVDRENDRFLAGIEYLIDIYTLASCNSFIAGRNGGAAAVVIVNDLKFERIRIL
jgi:hypothetical protein